MTVGVCPNEWGCVQAVVKYETTKMGNNSTGNWKVNEANIKCEYNRAGERILGWLEIVGISSLEQTGKKKEENLFDWRFNNSKNQ